LSTKRYKVRESGNENVLCARISFQASATTINGRAVAVAAEKEPRARKKNLYMAKTSLLVVEK
jgi:hypothetical protein